jgi:hypothetical protein
MITIPLYSLLIIFGIFFLIFAVFIIANVMHIVLTGSATAVSFIITLLILLMTFAALYGTWYFLQNANWSEQLTIWNSGWLASIFRTNF